MINQLIKTQRWDKQRAVGWLIKYQAQKKKKKNNNPYISYSQKKKVRKRERTKTELIRKQNLTQQNHLLNFNVHANQQVKALKNLKPIVIIPGKLSSNNIATLLISCIFFQRNYPDPKWASFLPSFLFAFFSTGHIL